MAHDTPIMLLHLTEETDKTPEAAGTIKVLWNIELDVAHAKDALLQAKVKQAA
jgi:hypothetical protein